MPSVVILPGWSLSFVVVAPVENPSYVYVERICDLFEQLFAPMNPKSVIFCAEEKFEFSVASAVAFLSANECLVFSSFALRALLIYWDLSPSLKAIGGLPAADGDTMQSSALTVEAEQARFSSSQSPGLAFRISSVVLLDCLLWKACV